MKILLRKLGLILPIFILISHTAFADMIAVNPFADPIVKFVLLLLISVVEIIIIKFGLKISFWKSVWTVLIANIVTAIVGVVFLKDFLVDFHTSKITLELFLQVIVIFIATFLMELGILRGLIKEPPFKKLLLFVFLANLATYLILILIINIPYIL